MLQPMTPVASSAPHPAEAPRNGDSAPPAFDAAVRAQTRRRRTFAIISHPDAGKTTLTEKLLLYSGCVDEAGAVRGRKSQRAATSDWMELERERGISVSSTVLTFEYRGYQINLLDTPGHQDFSEDTYRTLTAADCAVMVLDAAKGIEAQTAKLFKICAQRKIPILTFVNKMDRPGREPLDLLGEIEQVLGITAVPLNWPVGTGLDFRGVYDRGAESVLLFQPVPRGSLTVRVERTSLDAAAGVLPGQIHGRLSEEIELLDVAGGTFDRERFLRGEATPVFFGSALTNYGVEPFLDAFLDLSPSPGPRAGTNGPVQPDRPQFAGFVFKIQANLDPRHRDRVAFVRVCSGRFVREMEVTHARTGQKLRIKRSHRLFAQERETMDEAWPGDVIGLINPGHFRLGDTLCEGEPLHYEGQWQFDPERFAVIRCTDTLRRKQFNKGLDQLVEEGAVQVLFDPHAQTREPVLAAVGELQFEVVQYRLESEYSSKTTLHPLPYTLARWVAGDPADLAAIRLPSGARQMVDQHGRPVVLFDGQWQLNYCRELNPGLRLTSISGAECDLRIGSDGL